MKNEIKIRKAKVKDLPEIVKMRYELLKYHEELDSYLAGSKDAKKVFYKFFKSCIYSKKKKLLVAEVNETIAGFCFTSFFKKISPLKAEIIGQLDDMYVYPKFRRIGIGKELLNEIYKWFKEKNIKNVELMVHTENKIGYNAWTKYGFKDFLVKKRKKL